MKLSELFGPHVKFKIKRPIINDTGNDKIVYLGTDAIQRSFSGSQASIPGQRQTIPKINRKKLRIKQICRIAPDNGNGETLWLDNPTSTPCSSCGY